jgi:hypothetical protein
LAHHVGDSENPHGRELKQDEVAVSEVLSFGDGAVVKVGGASFPAAALLAATTSNVEGRRVEKIDFDSPGPLGLVVKVKGVGGIWSVLSIHRRVASAKPKGTVGDVMIGYFGEDTLADEKNEFVIYNSGDAGLPLRAVVLCE